MRSASLALAALTGIAVSAFATPAGALTHNSSSTMGAAAESLDPLAIVHCRSYKHRSYNHGWSYGCGGGGYGVSVHRRGVVEEREGRRGRVGIRERSTTRSERDVRSRESTTTRGERKTGGGSETRSGSTPAGTTGNRGGGAGGGGGTPGQSGGQR
jgi:hypothetical protein